MTWVKRASVPHRCPVPMSEFEYTLPAPPPPRSGWQGHEPPKPSTLRTREATGRYGDLWRCDDCGQLWRVGYVCDGCDVYGRGRHGGQCSVGYEWRPAYLWQRLVHRWRRR